MIKRFLMLCSLAAFLACIGLPVMFFTGALDERDFRISFLLASLGWFVCAGLWNRYRKRNPVQ